MNKADVNYRYKERNSCKRSLIKNKQYGKNDEADQINANLINHSTNIFPKIIPIPISTFCHSLMA